jgi:formylglycine-generating enzyme
MTEHDEYDDFVIQIGPPGVDGHHSVIVIKSPAGKGGRGRLPASLLDPSSPVAGTGTRERSTDGATTRAVNFGNVEVKPLDEVGRELFDALFAEEIASLFQQSYGKVLAKGRRLRIRLQLNVEDASIAPVATLPWELMYRHDRREFLVLSADTTLVRSLDVPIGAYDPPAITGPVRVLFVMANPRGDLDLHAERAEIEKQLAEDLRELPANEASERREIVAEFLEDATFATLEDRLRNKDYHIIHFMGHGAFDEQHQGQLLFHDGTLRSGADLGELLKRERMTRLVTLNACRTAEGSGKAGADPFAGVAAALVMAGVPAVVAMQFPITDAAAIAFSARLYSALGRGEPLEEAVDLGRRRIKALARDQREWATPVLFVGDTTPFRELVSKTPTAVSSALVVVSSAKALTVVAPQHQHQGRMWGAAAAVVLVAGGLAAYLMIPRPAPTAPTAALETKGVAPPTPAPIVSPVVSPTPDPAGAPRRPLPEMVTIPAGTFTMGSAGGEDGRSRNEGPTRMVSVPAFELGTHEVTVEQFQAFADDPVNKDLQIDGCAAPTGGWRPNRNWSWLSPGFEQTGRHPVACVSLKDAEGFLAWLNQVAGKSFRLASEAEWEYAARAGTTGPRYWDNPEETCEYAQTLYKPPRCNSRSQNTAPVGVPKRPNAFGLYDMLGNVSEWTADCWNDGYSGAPTNGAVRATGDCGHGVVRGGAWIHGLRDFRSAARMKFSVSSRANIIGFRVARTLP